MKSLARYIQEKLLIKKNKGVEYKYFPQTKDELKEIIKQSIKQKGNKVNLNDIDTSNITDMSNLFKGTDFNGDISHWDVSNVNNMRLMFHDCKNFNHNISDWDVSNVSNMEYMLGRCKSFNKDISNWDVSNVTNMYGVFYECANFNQDISAWDVSNVTNMRGMFYECESFNQDISNWDVSNVISYRNAFLHCPLKEKYKPNFK